MTTENIIHSMYNVDQFILNYIRKRGWEQYVPRTDDEMYTAFCRHLMYLITKFLEETRNRELFIQIPIEEFASISPDGNDDLQNQRWKHAVTTVMSCLALATAEKMHDMLFPKNYCDGDTFIYIGQRNNKPTPYVYFSSDRSNNRFQFQNSPLKIKCNRDTRANRVDFVNLLELKNKILPSLCEKCTQVQYNSAALVSIASAGKTKLKPSTDLVPWESSIFPTPLYFTANPSEVTGKNDKYDILVVMGDKKYVHNNLTIEQLYRNTKAKKIIYFGTTPIPQVDRYAFTFREMYRYCHANNMAEYERNFQFPTIVQLPFPWLQDRETELKSLLQECSLSDATVTASVQNSVIRRLLPFFSDADFSADKLAELKAYWDQERFGNLFGDPDTTANTVYSLYNWFQRLGFEGVNPKRQYMDEHADIPGFSRWQSFKSYVKNAVGNANANAIILDNLGVNRYDDRYMYILRYNLTMGITALYYKGIEDYALDSLKRFYNAENECYSSPLRTKWQTNLSESEDTPETVQRTLDDFLDFDYAYNQRVYKLQDANNYIVTFNDRTRCNIDGDVIIVDDKETMNIAELFECGDFRNKTIAYYQTPDNLEDLMKICLDLPYAEIEKYSLLWKKALLYRFEELARLHGENEAVKTIHKECPQLNEGIIKCYVSGNNRSFLREKDTMNTVCKYLCRLNLITEEDRSYVMKAQRAQQQIKSFGRNLKEDVLNLYCDEDYTSDILKLLLAQYTKKELLNSVIKKGIVSTITLKKQ